MKYSKLFSLLILVTLLTGSLNAEIPTKISYQGRMTDSEGNPIDTSVDINFKIYTAEVGGKLAWEQLHANVAVQNGLFTANLSSFSNINDIFVSECWLTMEIGTSPETEPRTLLVASPYSLLSLVADSARYAKKVLPNTVDSTSIKPGSISFSDIDDNGASIGQCIQWNGSAWIAGDVEGLSETEADARYLNTDGDTLKGDLVVRPDGDSTTAKLDEINNSGNLFLYDHGHTNIALFGDLYGELMCKRESNSSQAVIAAGDLGGYVSLFDSSGSFAAVISGYGDSGDDMVYLPEGSISSYEIHNETGISVYSKTASTIISGTTMQDILVFSVTIPESGYIYISANCTVELSGTTAFNRAYVQIDEDEGDSGGSNFYRIVGLGNYASTQYNYFPVSVDRTYYKDAAGSYTFRLEGKESTYNGTDADVYVQRPCATVLYIPTSYNAVKSYVSDPNGFKDAKMVTIENPENKNETKTLYEVDLRELELKVEKRESERLSKLSCN